MQMSSHREHTRGEYLGHDAQAKWKSVPFVNLENPYMIPQCKVKVAPMWPVNGHMKVGIIETERHYSSTLMNTPQAKSQSFGAEFVHPQKLKTFEDEDGSKVFLGPRT